MVQTEEQTLIQQLANLLIAGLIPAMNAGRYDFLLAPITVNAERAENMLFTEGYLNTALQFCIRKDNTAMRNRLDTGLKCMKLDGSLATISKKWFGVEPGKDDAERVVSPGYGAPGFAGYEPTPHTPKCN